MNASSLTPVTSWAPAPGSLISIWRNDTGQFVLEFYNKIRLCTAPASPQEMSHWLNDLAASAARRTKVSLSPPLEVSFRPWNVASGEALAHVTVTDRSVQKMPSVFISRTDEFSRYATAAAKILSTA